MYRSLKEFVGVNIREGGQALAAMAGMVAICILLAPAAFAQGSDVQALLDRINRLEADLNNIQRKVYQGQDIPAPKFSNPGNSTAMAGGEAAALLSTRLDALEEQQRQSTGRIEEVRFKIDQIASRFDKLVLDIDFRLTAIERNQSGTGLNVAEGSGQPGNQVPLQNTVPSNDIAAASSDAPGTQGFAKGPQILGTIRAPSGGDSLESGAVATATAPVTADPVIADDPNTQYNHAISLIRKDEFAEAETAFATFLQAYKDHTLAGNAQYWLGETFYVRGDYPNAASAFLHGYQVYPDNSKAADNLLKLAMTLGRMEQIEEACATFQQLDKQFPKMAVRLKRIENREKNKLGCL